MANLQQLVRAFQQYSTDEGHFPPNPDDGNTTPGNAWVPGQVNPGGAQEFNSDILKDTSRSLLYRYLGSSADPRVFRCPADFRYGRYQGSIFALKGTLVPVARSYSMNLAVGVNPYSAGTVAVDGAWLDNKHGHFAGQTWRTYARFDDVLAPSPADLTIILDEDQYSINDGVFAFGMERPEWIDWPSTRHGMSGVLSFADGHVQPHHWKDETTVVQPPNVAVRSLTNSPDWDWLRQHISARIRPQ